MFLTFKIFCALRYTQSQAGVMVSVSCQLKLDRQRCFFIVCPPPQFTWGDTNFSNHFTGGKLRKPEKMAVILKTIVNQKANLVKNQIKRSQGYEEYLQYQYIGDASSEDSSFEVQPVFHRQFWLARATELLPVLKNKQTTK